VLHGDAAELPALLAQLDGPAAPVRVQHIVSGLPLLSIPTPVRQRILHAGAQVLAPGGRLLQFTYALHGLALAAGRPCVPAPRARAGQPAAGAGGRAGAPLSA
jgi:phospholipid N-methyltransferase